jgi:hypothetical protein
MARNHRNKQKIAPIEISPKGFRLGDRVCYKTYELLILNQQEIGTSDIPENCFIIKAIYSSATNFRSKIGPCWELQLINEEGEMRGLELEENLEKIPFN